LALQAGETMQRAHAAARFAVDVVLKVSDRDVVDVRHLPRIAFLGRRLLVGFHGHACAQHLASVGIPNVILGRPALTSL
jgi:hypothetical protein